MTQHAKQRLKERHDIDATEADIREIRRQITEGEAVLMGNNHITKDMGTYAVMVQGTAVMVLFNRNNGCVVTVYAKDHTPNGAPRKKRRKFRAQGRAKKMGRRPQPDDEAA